MFAKIPAAAGSYLIDSYLIHIYAYMYLSTYLPTYLKFRYLARRPYTYSCKVLEL
eukprot:SAG31_NODE_30247_length_383_cov_1.640845_1_plen_54_part_01